MRSLTLYCFYAKIILIGCGVRTNTAEENPDKQTRVVTISRIVESRAATHQPVPLGNSKGELIPHGGDVAAGATVMAAAPSWHIENHKLNAELMSADGKSRLQRIFRKVGPPVSFFYHDEIITVRSM